MVSHAERRICTARAPLRGSSSYGAHEVRLAMGSAHWASHETMLQCWVSASRSATSQNASSVWESSVGAEMGAQKTTRLCTPVSQSLEQVVHGVTAQRKADLRSHTLCGTEPTSKLCSRLEFVGCTYSTGVYTAGPCRVVRGS